MREQARGGVAGWMGWMGWMGWGLVGLMENDGRETLQFGIGLPSPLWMS
jgi:hypothetical protein